MNMPRFTAEASLYETTRHYRPGRYTIDSSAQTGSSVWPALREQEGEIINVHGCPPGSIAVGEQPNITCVFIAPGGAGGGDGGIPPGGRPEDGPGGPYSTKYPNRGNPYASWACTSNNPIFDWQNNPDALACVKQNEKSKGPVYHSVFCRRKGAEGGGYPKKNELFCCKENTETNRVYDCEDIPCNTCQP